MGLPAKLKDEEIMEIQDLWDIEGLNTEQIHEKTGKSLASIYKYINAPRLRERLRLQEEKEAGLYETTPVKKTILTETDEKPSVMARPVDGQPKKAVLTPAREPLAQPQQPVALPAITQEPADWLQEFLNQYAPPLTKGFIKIITDRARIRRDLPSAAQLTDDINAPGSGVKSIHHAAWIADIYEHQVKDYLFQRQQEANYYKQPYRGVEIAPPVYGQDYRGVPINPQFQQPPMIQQPGYQQPYDGRGFNVPSYYPQPPHSIADDRLARLEDDIRRRDEIERQRLERELSAIKMQINQGGQIDPQIVALQQELKTLAEERRRETEDRLRGMEAKLSTGVGMNPTDVQRMIEAERGKITGDDIRRMISESMSNVGKITENEVRLAEARDHHALEVMKLQEKGKTRETIANAVKTGFSSVGQAIFRTAQELGSSEEREMPGISDGRHMWQADCPWCSESITAPLSAKTVRCPSCGRELDVSPKTEEEPEPRTAYVPHVETRPSAVKPVQPPYMPPPMKVTKDQRSVSYTIEQPPILEEEIEPQVQETRYSKAVCPGCNTTLTVPLDSKIVECPICMKRLQVGIEYPMPNEEIEPLKEPEPRKTSPVIKKEVEELKPKTWQPSYKKKDVIPEFYGGEPQEIKPTPPIEPSAKESPPDWREQLAKKSGDITEGMQKQAIEKAKTKKHVKTSEAQVEEAMPSSPEMIKKSKEIHFVRTAEELEKEIEMEGLSEPEIMLTKDESVEQYVSKLIDFECPECGKSFEREQQLKGHMLHHIRKKKEDVKK